MDTRRRSLGKAMVPGALVALALATLAALRPPALEDLELALYDRRAGVMARQHPPAPGVVLVKIDDATLRMAGNAFPLPREALAAVIAEARSAGARVLALDLVLDAAAERPELNAALEAAIGGGGVALAAVLGPPGAPEAPVLAGRAALLARHRLALPATPAAPARFDLTATPELVRFGLRADALGGVSQQQETNGRIYALRHLYPTPAGTLPSLPLAAAWLALGRPPLALEPGALRLGGARFPLDETGRVLVRWSARPAGGRAGYPELSARLLLRAALARDGVEDPEGPLPGDALRPLQGAVAVISVTAAAGKDKRPTPVNHAANGGEIIANAVDNLLHGEAIRRLPAAAEGLVTLAVALALAALAGLSGITGWRPAAAVAASTALILLLVAGWLALATLALGRGLWLPAVAPAVGGLLAAGAVDVRLLALEHRDRRFVHDALGRYTSPALVDTLLANRSLLDRFGGARQDLTVYFSDIRGFTSFSERLDPERLVELLNDYFSVLTEIVERHGGYVDKYIGDALMALWGAPLTAPDHALRACRAALEMRAAVAARRPGWLARYGVDLAVGAGLNTGPMVAGNVGSRRKTNYTVLGDAVNLASRLEGATKRYGAAILVGEGTRRAAGEAVVARELDLLRVKGKQDGVRVFELVGLAPAGPEDVAWLARWDAALALYRAARFGEAGEAFAALLAERPGDGPAAVYRTRARELAAAPPGPGWDGIFELHEK